MSKLPVLVTGGAGYIGSHAVLALRDAGWPVAVIDDLSTGTREIVPEDVPFYEGSIADQALLDRVLADQKSRAIMHFAGSIVVPESIDKPQQHGRHPRSDLGGGRGGRRAYPVFLHRRRLRRAGAGTG